MSDNTSHTNSSDSSVNTISVSTHNIAMESSSSAVPQYVAHDSSLTVSERRAKKRKLSKRKRLEVTETENEKPKLWLLIRMDGQFQLLEIVHLLPENNLGVILRFVQRKIGTGQRRIEFHKPASRGPSEQERYYLDKNRYLEQLIQDTPMDNRLQVQPDTKIHELGEVSTKPTVPLIMKVCDPSPLVSPIGTAPTSVIQGNFALAPPYSYMSTSSPCQVLFFNSIKDVTFENGFLHFPENILNSEVKRLYVRESYVAIAEQIKYGVNKVIVTGTPGIGKSWFLFYLLWKLVNMGKRVLFILHPFSIYYDENGNVYDLSDLPKKNNYTFWNDSLCCLFDAKEMSYGSLSHFPYPLCTFVISMSPRRSLINDFKKPPNPQIFYMPIWTIDELQLIASNYPLAEDVWKDRFSILGGIPRHLFEVIEEDAMMMLEKACSKVNLFDIISIAGIDSTVNENTRLVHCLAHIVSSPPCTTSSVSYPSLTALNLIFKKFEAHARKELNFVLSAADGNAIAAVLCGHIFEPYALKKLEEGGNFKCRQVLDGRTKPKNVPEQFYLTIPRSNSEVVNCGVKNDQIPGRLYKPLAKNHTSIDAWIPGIGVFQLTVSKNHEIKESEAVKESLKTLGKDAKFYWVLDPTSFETFSRKVPHDMPQYAICMPLPLEDSRIVAQNALLGNHETQ